jgi:choline dehydrogenase-like flavoprotein
MQLIGRVALAALELSPFPRRFSRLSVEARTRHIERMESSRSLNRRSIVLLAKTLTCVPYTSDARVREVVGWEPRCESAEPPPAVELPVLPPPREDLRCDVVVVGSGAGGASAARVLAEAGLDVVVLEEGEHHDARDFRTDPAHALRTLYREGGLTACDGRPPIPLPVGRCVGGTTVINSGTAVRPPGDVLARWRDEHGIAWAPELEGEFEAVERDLDVTPVDPATAGRNAELCRAGADAIGAANGPLPRAAGRVTRCGTCPMGCALDAKRAMHVSELPRAVAAGARIVARARVGRVLVEEGRAVGVACAGFAVHARSVVLAAGALGTPELLLRQGLTGHVGRHLRIQPACWVGARHAGEEIRGWDGVMQSYYIDEWERRSVLLEATFTPLPFGGAWLLGTGRKHQEAMLGFGNVGSIGVHLSDRSTGRVGLSGDGSMRAGYRLSDEDARRIQLGIARAAEVHFAAGATEVYPNIGRVGVLGFDRLADFESMSIKPAELRLEAFHPMGTARISADPSEGVCTPTGAVNGVDALYVADASLFPTSVGVNPMLTIVAFAKRIAAGLSERL